MVADQDSRNTVQCMIQDYCTGVMISPSPDLLPDVFCLMVRIFRLMLVSLSLSLYIYIYVCVWGGGAEHLAVHMLHMIVIAKG